MRAHRKRTHTLESAFTLTELLVTITIIIVLAALSFVIITRARSAAVRVLATNNLAQVQLANISYATDNNGRFMPIETFDDKGVNYVPWFENPQFLGYLKGDSGVYSSNGQVDKTLPLSMMDPIVVRARQKLYDNLSASFGYQTEGVPNRNFKTPNSHGSFAMSNLTAPERSACFITATDWTVKYATRFLWQGVAAVEGKTTNQKMAYRHNKKALVAYYDGHVGEVTMEDIRKIDTQGGANNIFWKADAK